MRFYAHTIDGHPESEWELLEFHLAEVSTLASEFSKSFDAAEWGALAGLWHDLGKYRPGFQHRLRDPSIRCEHSGAGALLAMERDARLGQLLAFVIAGHHAGLANPRDTESPPPGASFPRALDYRLRDAKDGLREALENAPKGVSEQRLPALPRQLITDRSVAPETGKRRAEFWIRFLFSALVDADRLRTEAFCDPARSTVRQARLPVSISDLRDKLEDVYSNWFARLDVDRPITRARHEVASACRDAAEEPPGLFSLTVPTGGGKTLAGMRFALSHAALHGLSRVIVVIPFTSIIEQNAKAYSDVFGAELVLEHHSNLDPERSRDENGESVTRQQELAAENWDSPIVVTTTVQFLESLFSNHPSRCRKLHNIAKSVIVLDEVQSLPPEFLAPILDMLRELTERYGCTVVLSTATPPALKKRPAMMHGLENVREIVADPPALARVLRRVEYEWPTPGNPPREWPELASELAEHPLVLVVVHRRADARDLALALQATLPAGESIRHLSALMCPAHRLEILGQIRDDLKSGRPCRLISTQLIEAGVDVDFPVIYRALGGLDSIVQAAGRCNREGRIERGRVVVFEPPSKPPRGMPSKAVKVTELMLRAAVLEGVSLDPDDPLIQREYFERFYSTTIHDLRNIQRDRAQFNFASVAANFRLIEDGFTHAIIVPWKDGERRLANLRRAMQNPAIPGPPLRELFRAVQPYTVSIYDDAFERARAGAAIEEIAEGVYALAATHARHYTSDFGLVIGDDIGVADPSALIK